MSKLAKKPSVGRKFSFELPRLKIGPSKTDGKSSKDHSATEPESLEPTPKSVRPALSPKVDQQLRLACAYVLQDFKPSQKIYQEQYGRNEGRERQPSEFKPYYELRKEAYGIIKDGDQQSTDREVEASVETQSEQAKSVILHRPESDIQIRELSSNLKITAPESLEAPKRKPTIKSQAFFEALHPDWKNLEDEPVPPLPKKEQSDDEAIHVDLSSFNPPIASPAFFGGFDLERIRQATARAIQEPLQSVSPEIAQTSVFSPLKRSLSNPIHSRNVSVEQANFESRAESVGTAASIARTEGTEHSRKPSTAPTSVAITPARNSIRTSSQAAGFSSDKFLTSDIEWMRRELESHQKAEEEARARLELENQVLSSIGLKTGPAQSNQSLITSTQVSTQKHPPRSSSRAQKIEPREQLERTRKRQGSIQERRNVPPLPQLDSRQGRELERSESKRRRSTPRSESRQELDMLRSESRQSQRSERLGEDAEQASQKDTSRDVKDSFTRPVPERPKSSDLEVSRASSRTRRLFRVYGPLKDGTITPPASLESSKPQSRTRSTESIHIAVSALAPATDTASNKLRDWKPSQAQEDAPISDLAGSNTQVSKRFSRDLSYELQQASDHRKSKPSVNLNRDLPPLPSLDQWKPVEPTKTRHIASMISPRSAHFDFSLAASASETNLLLVEREDIPLRLGTVTASSSRIHSIYSRYSKIPDDWTPDGAPPYTPLPTDADFPKSATHERFDFNDEHDTTPLASPPTLTVDTSQRRIPSEYMFHANFGKAITSPMAPPPIPADVEVPAKTIRRKTEDMFLPDLDARARTASNGNMGPETSSATKTAPVVNYSRSVPRQPNVLRKQNSTRAQISAPVGNDQVISHTKTASEQINFSRKPDTESYTHLYDLGYRNIMSIQRTQDVDLQAASAPGRTPSKKWWKRGTSKRERNALGDISNAGSQPSFVMMNENAVAQF